MTLNRIVYPLNVGQNGAEVGNLQDALLLSVERDTLQLQDQE
jgi:hypothetical protein